MKVTAINRFFQKAAVWQIRHRILLLAGILLVTALGLGGLGRMRFVSASSGWFDKAEEIELATEEFEERFGNNDTIGILVEAEDVFHPEVLRMIRELGDELLRKVPYADDIASLTELEITLGTEEGMAVINPVGDEIPSDPDELEEIRRLVLSRPSLADKLVTSDGRETWISLSLRKYPAEETWVDGEDPMYESGRAAVAIVTDPRWRSDAYTIKAAGMPYTETEEQEFMGREAALRVFSGMAVMILMLVLFLRSLRGVLVPASTTVIGILLVFGFMGWLDIGINSTLMTLPLLLGMALSVGYSVHLVNAFRRLWNRGLTRKEAVVGAVEKTGWPILFTAFTTMGSMASFAVAGIVPVRWLGLTCAAVVFTVYLYVILLIPILFSFGKERRKAAASPAKASRADRFFPRLGEGVIRRKRAITLLSLALLILALPGITKIEVNIDSFKFMGLRVPYIKRLHSIVNSQLGSYLTYNLTVGFEEEDAVKDPDVLRRFERLLDAAGRFELTKKAGETAKIFSVLDILKDLNRTLHENDPAYYAVPESRELVSQMLFLYSMSGGTEADQWVDEEYKVLRAQVEISRYNANEIAWELKELQRMGAELFPEARLSVVGSAARFAEMNNKIVTAELKSFLTALVVIAILLAIVFSSLKTGLIGLIPNITPVIAIGGVMGYFGFDLDMMTMIIMPMLLGIAVDDTIHFINQIKYEFEQCGGYEQAVIRAFGSIGKTLAMTTVVLSLSFAAYAFSPVQAMRNIGLLAPLGLLTALGADYLITPVLMILTKPFGPERAPRAESPRAAARTPLKEVKQ